jgi:hypothetical protein
MPIYTVQGPDGKKYKIQGPEGATAEQLGQVIQGSATPSESTMGQEIKQSAGNVLAGLGRGAGSIGATLLSPIDAAARAVNGGKPISAGGIDIAGQDRRAGMDAALQSLGAETDSWMFKGGKLAGEIAGTAGMGGVLAKPLQALAASKYAHGIEPLLEGGIKALQTGGFRVGPLAGTGAGTVARVLGGASVGGASAGLVNPEDAKTGAFIGGGLPLVAQGSGFVGNAIRGKMANASPATSAQKLAAAQQGAAAGYVVPPADLNPNMGTELISGLSGKIKTAQVASQKNQAVTDMLARKELGLGADDVLNADVLQGIRNNAAQAYGPVRQAGMVSADKTFMKSLDNIAQTYQGANGAFPGLAKNDVGQMVDSLRVGQFDAGGAVDAIKVLRENADKAFRTGDTGVGKAAKEAAGALESQLERHLSAGGNTDALEALRDARKLIAKTYSVQKGLNSESGSVSAQVLAKQLEKGKPLSGELLTIAKMGSAFPKATQALKESPKAVSPLDWLAGGGASIATQNPLPLLGLMARPAARSYLLSPMAQRAALKNPGLLSNPEELGLLTQGAYRALPLLGAD